MVNPTREFIHKITACRRIIHLLAKYGLITRHDIKPLHHCLDEDVVRSYKILRALYNSYVNDQTLPKDSTILRFL